MNTTNERSTTMTITERLTRRKRQYQMKAAAYAAVARLTDDPTAAAQYKRCAAHATARADRMILTTDTSEK